MTAEPPRPGHLHAVPPPGAGAAAGALPLPPPAGGIAGLTPPLTRSHSGEFLTDVIVDLGYLSDERVQQVIAEARTAGRSPETLMLEQSLIDGDQLARAMAERYGLDHVDLNNFQVDMGAANLVNVQTARRYRAVPVGFVDPSTLVLAMADPANVLAIDDIQMITGLNCRVAVAAEVDIEALISRLNTLETSVAEAVSEDEEDEGGLDITDLRESADDAPVIKLVYSILGQAVADGASDIHFEPEEKDMRVRFRVDGVLHEAARVPKRMVSGVVSRIKIMSDLDIAEKRVPQDGRVGLTVEERKVDMRVVTMPTQRGEGATIRILDKDKALLSLDDLGMEGEQRARFEEVIRKPHGAILVTGPTGSGKSTTLYSALKEINDGAKNIITIEDPVEYQLAGVKQIGVNRRAGLTFASGLRSVLRADPDVIMVGEIRDAETARIGDRGRAHRPPGPDHPPHQRRPRRDHPAGEDGDRVLPDRVRGRVRGRPAPGPDPLHQLQAPHGPAQRRPARRGLPGRRRRRGLRAGRLRPLQRHRLQGPPRPLLGDDDGGDAQGHDRERLTPGGHRQDRPRRGHAHAARGRPPQGPRRRHQHRRSSPRLDLSSGSGLGPWSRPAWLRAEGSNPHISGWAPLHRGRGRAV